MTKKILIPLVTVIIAGAVGGYFFFAQKDSSSKFETVKAEVKDLTQTVEETGKVRGKKEIKLSFDRAGTLQNNLAQEGDLVQEGEKLAELDHDTLTIQKKEAQAGLKAAQAKLQKLRAGGSPSDVKVSQSQVEQAKENYQSALTDLQKTKKTVKNNIKQARDRLHDLRDDTSETVTSYEQAVVSARQNLDDTKEIYRQQIDKNRELSLSTCNSGISTANTALDEINKIIDDEDLRDLGVLSAKNSTYLTKTKKYYKESKKLWQEARDVYARAKEDDSRENIDSLLVKTLDMLDRTSTALDYCYQMLEKSVTSSQFPTSQLNSLKTIISQQTTNVNGAINSTQNIKSAWKNALTTYNAQVQAAENKLEEAKTKLNDAIDNAEDTLETATTTGEQKITLAQSKVQTAKKSLEVARAQLNKAESPARQEDIALARAEIEQAKASINLIEEKIKNSIIKAPVDGKITKVNYGITLGQVRKIYRREAAWRDSETQARLPQRRLRLNQQLQRVQYRQRYLRVRTCSFPSDLNETL